MTQAFELLVAGRFDEAAAAYRQVLAAKPADAGARDGLAAALMGAGRYEPAIPLMWALHEENLKQIPDTCGKLVDLACAYWCIDNRAKAVELAHGLVEGNLSHKINMAPDLAGGASFGLMLYYMGVTTRNAAEEDYAVAFLRKLKVKYDKSPTFYNSPKVTVQQLLGSATFEDALDSASRGERSLEAAVAKVRTSRAIAADVSVALFYDGVFHRAAGDAVGCQGRMQDVFNIGYWAEPVCWYFARHELGLDSA